MLIFFGFFIILKRIIATINNYKDNLILLCKKILIKEIFIFELIIYLFLAFGKIKDIQ